MLTRMCSESEQQKPLRSYWLFSVIFFFILHVSEYFEACPSSGSSLISLQHQVTFYHLFLYIPISMLFNFYLLKIVNVQNTFCNLNTSYRWFHLYLLLHHRCACNTWSFNQKQKAKKKWTVKIILKQRIGDSDLLNCRLLEPTHLFLCQ